MFYWADKNTFWFNFFSFLTLSFFYLSTHSLSLLDYFASSSHFDVYYCIILISVVLYDLFFCHHECYVQIAFFEQKSGTWWQTLHIRYEMTANTQQPKSPERNSYDAIVLEIACCCKSLSFVTRQGNERQKGGGGKVLSRKKAIKNKSYSLE